MRYPIPRFVSMKSVTPMSASFPLSLVTFTLNGCFQIGQMAVKTMEAGKAVHPHPQAPQLNQFTGEAVR